MKKRWQLQILVASSDLIKIHLHSSKLTFHHYREFEKSPLPELPTRIKINLKSRAAEKMASRREDRRRLENGESPEVIQRENSIFPPGYFAGLKISNLADAVGK